MTDKLKEALKAVDTQVKADPEMAAVQAPYTPPVVDFEQFEAGLIPTEMSGQDLAEHAMQTLRNMKAELERKNESLNAAIVAGQDEIERLKAESEAVGRMLASLGTVI